LASFSNYNFPIGLPPYCWKNNALRFPAQLGRYSQLDSPVANAVSDVSSSCWRIIICSREVAARDFLKPCRLPPTARKHFIARICYTNNLAILLHRMLRMFQSNAQNEAFYLGKI